MHTGPSAYGLQTTDTLGALMPENFQVPELMCGADSAGSILETFSVHSFQHLRGIFQIIQPLEGFNTAEIFGFVIKETVIVYGVSLLFV